MGTLQAALLLSLLAASGTGVGSGAGGGAERAGLAYGTDVAHQAETTVQAAVFSRVPSDLEAARGVVPSRTLRQRVVHTGVTLAARVAGSLSSLPMYPMVVGWGSARRRPEIEHLTQLELGPPREANVCLAYHVGGEAPRDGAYQVARASVESKGLMGGEVDVRIGRRGGVSLLLSRASFGASEAVPGRGLLLWRVGVTFYVLNPRYLGAMVQREPGIDGGIHGAPLERERNCGTRLGQGFVRRGTEGAATGWDDSWAFLRLSYLLRIAWGVGGADQAPTPTGPGSAGITGLQTINR